ncbi:uncharacterized protein LY79DRAFT_676095 [Colletotrichum navitas]|uniref:Uncharacterized protein n=1 Tax=Colletotrichum navitas TaxID=681940 RepID=A0AAD8VD08_9PEZI|nr:uncharacterized protein LY79DRAFT_676095 [Colletotrichum navitas]KAK1600095.1 hypothetical protein LY79DRAFT_676095 [Colletotrichum navitas]
MLSVASRASPNVPQTVIMADRRTLPRFEEVARVEHKRGRQSCELQTDSRKCAATGRARGPGGTCVGRYSQICLVEVLKIVSLDGFIWESDSINFCTPVLVYRVVSLRHPKLSRSSNVGGFAGGGAQP